MKCKYKNCTKEARDGEYCLIHKKLMKSSTFDISKVNKKTKLFFNEKFSYSTILRDLLAKCASNQSKFRYFKTGDVYVHLGGMKQTAINNSFSHLKENNINTHGSITSVIFANEYYVQSVRYEIVSTNLSGKKSNLNDSILTGQLLGDNITYITRALFMKRSTRKIEEWYMDHKTEVVILDTDRMIVSPRTAFWTTSLIDFEDSIYVEYAKDCNYFVAMMIANMFGYIYSGNTFERIHRPHYNQNKPYNW